MLWSLRTQNSRIFNWTALLKQWNDTSDSQPPVPVSTALENLRSETSPPIGHFLTYMNGEQDALKWFVYECVASSWMWGGGPRLYYIEQVLPYIDNLDSNFPLFPGSPGNNATVRSFLTSSLTQDALNYISMMPPLVSIGTTQQTPAVQETFPSITFNIIRSMDRSSEDDIVCIRKLGDDTYSYMYKDPLSNCQRGKRVVQENLTSDDVMNQVRLLFNLLCVDDEPFTALQVFLPNMPTVLVNVNSLTSTTRDLLYDSIESVLDTWPVHA